MNLSPRNQDLINALRCDNPACACHKNGSNKYTLHCPSHADKTPSLSLTIADSDKILLKDFGGCDQNAVISKLREMRLWHSATPSSGLTLQQYADAKRLPAEWLKSIGLREHKFNSTPRVLMSYLDENGSELAVRIRLSLHAEPRFSWRKGDKPTLYGLWRMKEIRRAGWVLLVEGESDCHTLWHHGLPALGVAGKDVWRGEWKKHLDGLTIYVWQEPDAETFAKRIGRDVPTLRVIPAPAEIKDPSAAHVQGIDIPAWLETLKAQSVALAEIEQGETQKQMAERAAQAASVLNHSDPLQLVETEIQELGYGGDINPAMIVYLAATSRLLELRQGSMPAHTILLGSASSGKSHTVNTARQLFPADAFHVIDAGSPRALIYDQADLRHRVVVFSEADSIPNDEDNPAASAIRNLLTEGRLHYSVVVRDEETGEFVTKEIDKPGPTVLLTTATRRLGEQMMTRLFTLEISDDPDKVRAALKAQAQIELHGTHEPDAALIAFQAYLQLRAPFRVFVPFADALADAIGQSITASRILRDYARLMALIKSIAVLRHRQRQIDAAGRIIAKIEDYATARELVNQMYSDSASGAGLRVRKVVEKVAKLRENDSGKYVSNSQIEQSLGLAKSSTSRSVNAALKAGWLVNHETRKGFPAALDVGDAMPEAGGLPEAAALRQEGVSLSQTPEQVEHLETPILSDDSARCSTVPNRSEIVEHLESPILSGDSARCSTVPPKSEGYTATMSLPATDDAAAKRPLTPAEREEWLEHARNWLENNRNHAEWDEHMASYEHRLERHYAQIDKKSSGVYPPENSGTVEHL